MKQNRMKMMLAVISLTGASVYAAQKPMPLASAKVQGRLDRANELLTKFLNDARGSKADYAPDKAIRVRLEEVVSLSDTEPDAMQWPIVQILQGLSQKKPFAANVFKIEGLPKSTAHFTVQDLRKQKYQKILTDLVSRPELSFLDQAPIK